MTIIKEGGRKRSIKDFYPTPIEFCDAVVNTVIPIDCYPDFICDPGAGGGVWGKAVAKKFPNAHIAGVEIQDGPKNSDRIYNVWYHEDYLNHVGLYGEYDLIIGNPPYSLAEEFIRHSLDLLAPAGYLIFLLRLSFLESKKRVDLYTKFPPKQVWISVSRISFTGDGHSDDQAYAVYVWQKNFIGKPELNWLNWKT